MKGTKKTSVIAVALAIVLALSILAGAGIMPAAQNDTPAGQAAEDAVSFNVVCSCCEKAMTGAEVTAEGTYELVLQTTPETPETPETSETPETPETPTEGGIDAQALEDDGTAEGEEPIVEPKPEDTVKRSTTDGKMPLTTAETVEGVEYTYTLKSIAYTVGAKGYESVSSTIEDVAALESKTITVTLTKEMPTIDGVVWNTPKQTLKINTNANFVMMTNIDYAKDNYKELLAERIELNSYDKETLQKEFRSLFKSDNVYVKSAGESFTGVSKGDSDERLVAAIDDHGNVYAEIISRYLKVTVTPDGWAQEKTLTINGTNVPGDAEWVKVGTTKYGIEALKSEAGITHKVSENGDYKIVLGWTKKADHFWNDDEDIEISSDTVNVSNIDKTPPTITEVTGYEGNAIKSLTVKVTDEDSSGVAEVNLATIEFGYATAEGNIELKGSYPETSETGESQTVTKSVFVKTYKGTYNGTYNKVECGEKIEPKIETSDGEIAKFNSEQEFDKAVEAAEKAAQNQARANAKAYFEDTDNEKKIIESLKPTVTFAKEHLDADKSFEDGVNLKISGNGEFDQVVIWAKDNVGRYSELYSVLSDTADTETKIIIDNTKPEISNIEVNGATDSSYAAAGKKSLDVSAKVTDANGIEKVTAILMRGNDKEKEIQLSLNEPAAENEYTGKIDVVDGDNYSIKIKAEDKAGNESEKISHSFTYDTIAPVWENTKSKDDVNGYYKTDYELPIQVKENRFDKGVLEYTRVDSDKDDTAQWTDETEYNITFSDEGVYTLKSLVLKDEPGNETEYKFDGVTFTIDKTNPIVTVEYDNNDVQNNKYFNAQRIATIKVTERNFEAGNKNKAIWVNEKVFENLTTAHKENKAIDPGVYVYCDCSVVEKIKLSASEWITNETDGIHEMTIPYNPDADYKFSVLVVDKAGNSRLYDPNNDSEKQEAPSDFTVDKIKPSITVNGLANASSYNGDVTGTVVLEDTNFDSATVQLTRADKDRVYDVTDLHVGAVPNGGKGGQVSIANFANTPENDGIYTLTVTAIDKAGNEADPVELTFSVNRFGSTYAFGDYLKSICGKHITAVDEDITITEINPDAISEGKVTVTRNGKPIDAGDIKPVLQRSASAGGGWYEYLYTVSKDSFTEDGLYRIVLSSKDAANNNPTNENYEDYEIMFWVDDTTPELAGMQGLEEAIYNEETHTVTFTVRDNLGLKSVDVYCNGELIAQFGENDFDGGDLVDAQFVLKENSGKQSIRIVATDLSGNVTDTDEKAENGEFVVTFDFNRTVTVSTNFFVRWFANTPLFIGSLVVIAAAAVGGYFFIAKRKKSAKETAEA